jgi:hypothetical protein
MILLKKVAWNSVERSSCNTHPVPRGRAKSKPTEDGEILELPTEVVIREYPVTEPWCEIVPVRRNPSMKKEKEMKNGAIACLHRSTQVRTGWD